MREKYNIATDKVELVADLPKEDEFKRWTGWDCPFSGLLPEGVELWKREDQRGILLSIKAPSLDKHITFVPSAKDMLGELWNKQIAPSVYQLGVLLFDKEFPGQYNEFVKMRARAAAFGLINVTPATE